MYNRRKVNMKFPGAVGLYVCILLLPVLKIEAQPAITKTDTSAPYGIISQTTALTCTDGTYDPTTSTFKFFKDSVEILNHIGETTTTGKYTAATSTGSIQMTILDVVISDQGSYSCSVGFNTAGSSFSLQVEVKPTNDTTATVGLCTGPGNDYSGDKLTFTCTDLYPSPTVQSVTDGTQTVVGTTNITTKTNSMFDLEWTASSSPKDYILTVAITTRSTYTFTVESNIKAGLDGTCSTMAPIIQCSTENAECSAADKCKCKTGYEPNAAATECSQSATTTTTSSTTTTTTTTTTTPSTTTSSTTTTSPSTTTTSPSTTTTSPSTTTTSSSTTTTSPSTTTTSPSTTTTSPSTAAIAPTTTSTDAITTTLIAETTESDTNTSAVSNERTVIIVVASTVGGVVLVGLVVFLGLFLYRAKRSGHGHGKRKHNHKRDTRQQPSGGEYIYSGQNNGQNMKISPSTASYMDIRHGYPHSIKDYPDRRLRVDHHKQAIGRHEGSQMRNTGNVKSRYSVHPRNIVPSRNTQNFYHHHYPRQDEWQRPATTGNIHPGHVNHALQSGYIYYQPQDYSDNWDMY